VSPPREADAITRALGHDASARLREAAKGIGWGLALYGVVLLIASKLQAKALGSLALQMVVAEWGAGRLAVAWSDPNDPIPTTASVARRAGRGAALGLACAATLVAFAVATGALRYHPNAPEPGSLAMGLGAAALVAARDELLLRGVVIRALRHTLPPTLVVLVCGWAAAAAEYGLSYEEGPPSATRLAISGMLAMCFASIWLVDRGAWMAFGAHAAWTTTTGACIRGGLLDLRPAPTSWGGVDGGLLASAAAAVVLAPLTLVALEWSRRAQKS